MRKKSNDISRMQRYRRKFFELFYAFRSMSFIKHILLLYIIITLTGSVLLYLPISHRRDVSFLNALFIAASAFSDTGLTTEGTAATFTMFGQAVIAMLIFVGGIGWFALKIYFFNILFGRPVSFSSRFTLTAERGSSKVGFTREIIKVSVSLLLISLAVASVALTIMFFYLPPEANPYHLDALRQNAGFDGKDMVYRNPHGDFATSLRFGIFHAISALNNAGFDIIGNNSVAPYYHQYGIQIVFIILFVMGGTGYPVFYDVYKWIQAKRRKETFRWSLFTKLSVVTYFLVAAIGVATTFAVELSAKNTLLFDRVGATNATAYSFWNNPMYGSTTDRSMALFFNCMSTRSAGFSTIRAGDLSNITLIIWSALMFIGSAPSSTAGGIRTTTFALVVVGLWSKIRGRDEVRIFNRRVAAETVSRSYVVFAVSVALLILTTMISYTSFADFGGITNSAGHLYATNTSLGFVGTRFTFNEMLFETASAFGTTGLSAGITPSLSVAAKVSLALLMFIGQLGVSSSVIVWRGRSPKARSYNYVEEDVTIG